MSINLTASWAETESSSPGWDVVVEESGWSWNWRPRKSCPSFAHQKSVGASDPPGGAPAKRHACSCDWSCGVAGFPSRGSGRGPCIAGAADRESGVRLISSQQVNLAFFFTRLCSPPRPLTTLTTNTLESPGSKRCIDRTASSALVRVRFWARYRQPASSKRQNIVLTLHAR